jgi:hypothetical protein
MKKLFLVSVVSVLFATTVSAQLRIGKDNLSSQPSWGPRGYDYAEYYYLPDIQVYYHVPARQFIYQSRNNWIFSSSLPPEYKDYDLYSGYKVVINEPRAYLQIERHRLKYRAYKGKYGKALLFRKNN